MSPRRNNRAIEVGIGNEAQAAVIVTPAWTPDDLVQIIETRVATHWLTREQADREIAAIRSAAGGQS
jgi:hypothetical protein